MINKAKDLQKELERINTIRKREKGKLSREMKLISEEELAKFYVDNNEEFKIIDECEKEILKIEKKLDVIIEFTGEKYYYKKSNAYYSYEKKKNGHQKRFFELFLL